MRLCGGYNLPHKSPKNRKTIKPEKLKHMVFFISCENDWRP